MSQAMARLGGFRVANDGLDERALERLLAVGQDLVGELDLETLLDRLLGVARELTGARYAAIEILDGRRKELERFLVSGIDGATLRTIGDLPRGRGALTLPIVVRGDKWGNLHLTEKQTGAFDERDEKALVVLANWAGVAISNARLYTNMEAERLHETMRAAEEERKRWARELHDETLQGLGALQVMLSSAKRSGAPEMQIEQVIGRLGEEIDRLQGLIAQLRPAALDEIGLGAAIENLAERMRDAFEIELAVDLDYEEGRAATRFDGEVESAIYRVVQEALNNARKHANAVRVTVAIREADGTVTVEARDDGSGFDAGATNGGFGLIGMSERIALVGGRLDVASAPGAGTAIQASVPTGRDALALRSAAS